ncbi:MAG: sigma-54 dependent transcriptional regulator [bacterium]|nr:sigma-54 dependent transcriptional regulator [bacterium]
MNNNYKVLVYDSSDEGCDSIRNILKDFNFEITECTNVKDFFKFLESIFFNIAFFDTENKDKIEIDIFQKFKAAMNPEINIILTSTTPKVEIAIRGIKFGVLDYLTKPLNKKEVLESVNKVVTKEQPFERTGLGLLIGVSPKMQQLYSEILNVAPTNSTVCIQGENGTGKELIARTIHNLSLRKDAKFIPVNCSAIPENLFETELFGHVKGAYSGASRDNPGIFRAAEKGTIFLDEIAEIPHSIQIKLLRVLEEKEVRSIGSAQNYKIDCRIITATNKDLERAVLQGKIREDFFHRLFVVSIIAVPLREKREDIPLLIEHFLNLTKGQNKKQISDEVLEALCSYDWPGNIRELENVIESACVTSSNNSLIKLTDIPLKIRGSKGFMPNRKSVLWDDTQKSLIQRTLAQTGNNKLKTAKLLGIDRKTLYRKLKRYKIISQLSQTQNVTQ